MEGEKREERRIKDKNKRGKRRGKGRNGRKSLGN